MKIIVNAIHAAGAPVPPEAGSFKMGAARNPRVLSASCTVRALRAPSAGLARHSPARRAKRTAIRGGHRLRPTARPAQGSSTLCAESQTLRITVGRSPGRKFARGVNPGPSVSAAKTRNTRWKCVKE